MPYASTAIALGFVLLAPLAASAAAEQKPQHVTAQVDPSAENIHVDVQQHRLEFDMRPGTDFDARRLRHAMEDASYGVGAIAVDGQPLQPPQASPTAHPGQGP